MILSDREIRVALQHGQIVIDPSPGDVAFSSTTLDLTLSSTYEVWNPPSPGVETVIVPGADDYKYPNLANMHPPRDMGTGLIVAPGQFLLGWTQERVSLPFTSRIAARVEGKSGLARLGLGVHVTAPTIQAGFSGRIQLEISNVGSLSIKLVPGMRVCQLIFEMVFGTPLQGYSGVFLDQ